jgi:adenine-specific DNA-methyltransferase
VANKQKLELTWIGKEHRPKDVPTSIWFHGDVGNTQEAKKEQVKLNALEPFSTPKPEKPIAHIINLATVS